MATLRQDLKYLDFIVNKKNPNDLFMVLHQELHNVWVIKDGGGEPPKEMPKHLINFTYVKCDPKVIKILYSDAKESKLETKSDNSNSSDKP